MRITIVAPHLPLSGDERAYIEYTLFSAVRPFEPVVRLVRVEITACTTSSGPDAVACAVRAWSAAGSIKVRGSSDRLYGAVDVAARRLALAAEAALGASSAGGRGRAVSP